MPRLRDVLRQEVTIPFQLLLGAFLLCLALFALYALQPQPTNVYGNFPDGSYWQGIDALMGHPTSYFLPNRLVTGTGFLLLIISIGKVVGSISIAWLLINVVFFVAMGMCFYALAEDILRNRAAAFLATLIMVLNYGPLVWGLTYTADMGGWFFFVAALYCAWKFFDGGEQSWIWKAAGLVALGGIFKEYALCAYIAIVCVVALKAGYRGPQKIALIIGTGMLSLVPFVIVNIYTWIVFHYTYIDWWVYNHIQAPNYPDSYLDEYIKILGSIYNFLWFLCVPGLIVFWQRRKELFTDRRLQFIVITALASLPVWIWMPFQRIFFITVPAFALIVGLFIVRSKQPWLYVPLFMAYAVWGFWMDAIILPGIHIQPLLNLLHF